ncbi:hypothetical protein A2154_01200 [Candidatus Gottesmanbacteria bacterium RBG_16_43_7]|uniref:Uncharacterized protein n=1 Tax=Candidatus Gottesmanbacteria bacterium RBG_16_43_7 TaxID=1798373 RepID=A0A1F5ZAA1_9BACT|nr:MAG: hypothetical protein A2154_01200 [Candidatus Gottesmanbacteria bacterium RBG_16_43_7]
MIEQSKYSNYPLLDNLQHTRRHLELEQLDIKLLQAQSGSADPVVATKAQRQLMALWDLKPEQDTRNAKSVDIIMQLETFSPGELKIMFNNLVALQLTEGCNGSCPFCVFGTKSGVTAKYSYDSIFRLFHEKSLLMNENPFLLYWNSDPFDYRDEDKSFLDVYTLYRQFLPNHSQYISTAIPRGGEEDFIRFMTYLASDYITGRNTNRRIVPVRLSLSSQNIQRVESTVLTLTDRLIDSGLSQTDINDFYEKTLTTVGRFNFFLLPIGPNIKKADDIKNTYSIACRDGVIISPAACQAIMMTAATVYEPSGQTVVNLTPGQTISLVPTKVREEHYTKFTIGIKSLTQRTILRQTMLPSIQRYDGENYSLPDTYDDLILKLGREAASINRLISNVTRLSDLELSPPVSDEEKSRFLRVSIEVFRERQIRINSLLSAAEHFSSTEHLAQNARLQIEYYILLTQTHLSKMNFLANQAEQGQHIEVVGIMAVLLSAAGRNELEKLPAILHALSEIDSTDLIALDKTDRTAVKKFLDNLITKIQNTDITSA